MRKSKEILKHILMIIFGLIMTYPLIWLFLAGVKPGNEILTTISLLPSRFVWSNYIDGWLMVKPYEFSRFFINTFLMVTGCIIGSTISSILVGYGFARMKFRFHKLLFSILFLTIMLPTIVTLIPRYITFSSLGWLNSYKPFIVPAFLGVGEGGAFFIFLIVQFIRGIPKELDESAKIDGCGALKTLIQVIAPLCKPAVFSICIFSFMWNWDNFQGQLIYLSKVQKFTIALALRTTIDVAGAENWGAILSMSFISIIPAILLFFTAQKYFVEGIATTGLKG